MGRKVSHTFADILEAIGGARRILLGSHARPDGDAIGSTVAMGMLLRAAGKETVTVNCDPVPDALRFLPGIDQIQSPHSVGEADLVITLDSADRARLGQEFWDAAEGCGRVINIDHHISNTEYGNINYIDSDSPATGQIVYQLAQRAGWQLNQEAAENLYAAISTDTGSFRYPSTTAETMRIAGDLVELGVDVGEINRLLYESYPLRRIEMLRFLLEDMQISGDGRYASVILPYHATEKLDLQAGDTEGAIDTIRAIDSVIVAVLFESLPDGQVRVSSRSKDPNYSVGALCAEFGGGGHTLAAGARMAGPIEVARQSFMERVALLMAAE